MTKLFASSSSSSRLLSIFLVALLCASLSNGFLFGHKFKNGCDPDPCKHDSKCQLDPKNANLSTCACKGEYTGVHCELKTGCYSKPCKNDGKCKNDPKDLTKFKCKCPDGFVGDKCDTSENFNHLKTTNPQHLGPGEVAFENFGPRC